MHEISGRVLLFPQLSHSLHCGVKTEIYNLLIYDEGHGYGSIEVLSNFWFLPGTLVSILKALMDPA